MPRRAGSADAATDVEAPLSQPQMVLLAIFRVSRGTTQKVPYEEIVLQAWKDFPSSFSLRNHPEHPDASDVHKKLYQSLKTDGLVASLGNKIFRLTEKGIEEAQRISERAVGKPKPVRIDAVRLSRSEESFIEQALKSRTFSAWKAGERDGLVDYDARVFFQFSTATPIDERRRRKSAGLEAIEKARAMGAGDSTALHELATFLADRFSNLFEER